MCLGLRPMSCSNQKFREWASSPFQPHCVCVRAFLPLASVFYLSAPLAWASGHSPGVVRS